jgi:hypothetical protein
MVYLGILSNMYREWDMVGAVAVHSAVTGCWLELVCGSMLAGVAW